MPRNTSAASLVDLLARTRSRTPHTQHGRLLQRVWSRRSRRRMNRRSSARAGCKGVTHCPSHCPLMPLSHSSAARSPNKCITQTTPPVKVVGGRRGAHGGGARRAGRARAVVRIPRGCLQRKCGIEGFGKNAHHQRRGDAQLVVPWFRWGAAAHGSRKGLIAGSMLAGSHAPEGLLARPKGGEGHM